MSMTTKAIRDCRVVEVRFPEPDDGHGSAAHVLADALLAGPLVAPPGGGGELPGQEQGGRITWTEGRYNSKSGTVSGIRLFTVSWSTTRDAPKPWVSRCALPGYEGKEWAALTVDDAKATAERVLVAWLRKIGASFDGEASRA